MVVGGSHPQRRLQDYGRVVYAPIAAIDISVVSLTAGVPYR